MFAGAYHFWVPASVIGLKTPHPTAEPMQTDNPEDPSATPQSTRMHADVNAGLSPEDIAHNEKVLARLRQALQAFEGDRPFHNYTQRQRYTPGNNRPQRWSSRKRSKQMETADAASNSTGPPAATLAETEVAHSRGVAGGTPPPHPSALCSSAFPRATLNDS